MSSNLTRQIMEDGFKTPQWSSEKITIPVKLLQEVAMALNPTRGLIQRMKCMPHLDARDHRALSWGKEAYANVIDILIPALDQSLKEKGYEHGSQR